jgi:hypothetical protein
MKQNAKARRATTPLRVALGLLVLTSAARADTNQKGCSNGTLVGDYALTIQGTLAVPGGTVQDGAGLPIRGVVLTHFDGNGNLTQLDHVVVNGAPPAMDWTPGTGTYIVNSDCTGTAVINSASNPAGPLNVHLVVSQRGKQIQQVVDTNAVTALGTKVE